MSQTVFAQRFQLLHELGHGSFGKVYEAFDTVDSRSVALKIHSVMRDGMLENRIAEALTGAPGFPTVYQTGIWQNRAFLAMELLGAPLSVIEDTEKMNLMTVLDIADQVILRIQALHQQQFVHRDIKPANFLLGDYADRNVVYMIDFGLCKPFIDSQTNVHIPFRVNCKQTGNARYASVNAHLGYEQSRRDDMEAAMYMIVHFLRGTLPWCEVGGDSTEERRRRMAQTKLTTSIDMTCAGCPPEFAEILKQIRRLQFEERPDYDGYRRMLAEVAERERGRWPVQVLKVEPQHVCSPLLVLPPLDMREAGIRPTVSKVDSPHKFRLPLRQVRRVTSMSPVRIKH
jgi:serine/threonine protein kinase